MITVGMNYEILDGKEEAFTRKFALVLEAMRQTPGHKRTSLYSDVFNDRLYLIVSEWESRSSFDAFILSDQFARVTSWGKDHILAGRPTHRVYDAEGDGAVTGSCPQHRFSGSHSVPS